MTYSPACKQNTRKIDARQFVAWVNQSVPETKKICEHDRTKNLAKLKEKDTNINMCVSVTDIPESAVIIQPDNAGQWRVLQEGDKKKWDSLCDYLILWESADKVFAVFIELKGTSPHQNGKFQLLWTTPMLQYLWFAFNADNHLALNPANLCMITKYVEIGDRKNPRFAKQLVRLTSSPYFHSELLKGIMVNYSERKCLSIQEILTN